MRYFRSLPSVYAEVCQHLDLEYGYPNADTKTLRSLPEISTLLSDNDGRVYVAVENEYCDYILPGQMLPELLASGAVEEVDAAAYAALLPGE